MPIVVDRLLIVVVAGVCLLKFFLAFRINVHWDEFYFLSFVHDHLRGALESRLQTFHVHLFSWLPLISEGEIDQIVAGRLVMACFAGGSAWFVYAIARHFASRHAALFATLAYLSLNVVVEHGASFRADPIPTFLVLLAVHAAVRRPACAPAALTAGAALALASLVSIKTAIYLPVVAAVIWCAPTTLRTRFRFGALAALSFAATFAPLYLLHDLALAAPEAAAVGDQLDRVASRMFFKEGLLPRAIHLLWVLQVNALFWLLVLAGAVLALARALRARGRTAWLPLALALPVLTPLVYRNAFAYYYAFALPTTCVVVAIAFEKLRQVAAARARSPAAVAVSLVIAAQILLLALFAGYYVTDSNAAQRRVLQVVHSVFPEPTPYIDGYGVVATFPRHGFFMSTWGMRNYHEAGQPVFPSLAVRDQPPMLLADSPSLYVALFPGFRAHPLRELLPEDKRFLQENYLQHWDLLFVAGKKLAPAPDGDMTFDLVIAGEYRLEAAGAVEIDGVSVQSGEVVRLEAGSHAFRMAPGQATALLRWAAARPAPAVAPVGLNGFFGRAKLVLSDAAPDQDGR